MRDKNQRAVRAPPAQSFDTCLTATSGPCENYAPSDRHGHERAGRKASPCVGRSAVWLINT
jgi:hypothetical protein